MGNKDGEKRQPASSPGHNSSALYFKRTPVYLWCHFIARVLFQRGCSVVPPCLKVSPLKLQPEFYSEPPADLCACEFSHINIHASMRFTLSNHLVWGFLGFFGLFLFSIRAVTSYRAMHPYSSFLIYGVNVLLKMGALPLVYISLSSCSGKSDDAPYSAADVHEGTSHNFSGEI